MDAVQIVRACVVVGMGMVTTYILALPYINYKKYNNKYKNKGVNMEYKKAHATWGNPIVIKERDNTHVVYDTELVEGDEVLVNNKEIGVVVPSQHPHHNLEISTKEYKTYYVDRKGCSGSLKVAYLIRRPCSTKYKIIYKTKHSNIVYVSEGYYKSKQHFIQSNPTVLNDVNMSSIEVYPHASVWE